jgi:uncharacterized membrane protein YccC
MPRRGRPPERAITLFEDAAERSRLSMRQRLERVRAGWRTFVQAGIATALAWTIAHDAIGHARPFFAPIAAIVTLGATLGQRTRRAVEIATGVTVGIAVADLLVRLIGQGTLQLVVIVLLAMTAAVLLGSGTLVVTQAGTSAVLVVTLQNPDQGITFARSIDAGVGAASALLVSLVIFPVDSLRLVRDAAEPVLRELAETIEDIAEGLQARSPEAAEAALERARAIDDDQHRFREALDVGREAANPAMARRSPRAQLALYAAAAANIDLAVRNTRVLARGAIRAVETGDATPPDVVHALHDLAESVRNLAAVLDDPGRHVEVAEPALRAAERATRVLEDTANLSVSVIVGQIRSTAVDLLESTGMGHPEAVRLVRDAALQGRDEPTPRSADIP